MVQVNNSNASSSLTFTNNDTIKSDHIASGKDPVTNAKVVQTESKGFFASILQTLKDAFNISMSFLGFSDKPISERKVSLLPAQTDKGAPTISSLIKQSDGLASKAEVFLKKSKDFADRTKGIERHGEAMDAVSNTAKEALKSKSTPKSTRAKYEALSRQVDKANEGIQKRKEKLETMRGKTSLLSEKANDFQKAATRLKEQMQQENEAYDNSALGKIGNYLSKLFS